MRFRAVEFYDMAWCKNRIGMVWTDDTAGIIVDNGPGTEPVGVGLAQSWTETGCTAHMAADTPMVWRFGLHREYFNWVFETREYVIGQIESDNPKAISMDRKFGFKEVARIPEGFRKGSDMIIMMMRREDCRYIDQPTKLRAVNNG
jgi:hypothetical protein